MSSYSAVDLFAGAGGATRGLRDAGFRVLAAVENDIEAAETYRANHPRVFLFSEDIRNVTPEEMMQAANLKPGDLDLLKACPPCQGYSTLAKGEIDESRNDLVLDVARFVESLLPKLVLLENVPGLQKDRRMRDLLDRLSKVGYQFSASVTDATLFGVPQKRKRFILFGVRGDGIAEFTSLLELLPPRFGSVNTTAGKALERLARYRRTSDPLDIYRKSTPEVIGRIASIPVGGNRFDLPEEHQLTCHKKLSNRSAASSYGRVKLNEPAPTMTTRCTTPACGTFVHPTENRGLTLREAAAFQTFPVRYKFLGNYGSIERQIGNAVPVRMAKGLGLIATSLLGSFAGASESKPT
ncbi:DNA cytosine methyltransferase [Streptomyces angustmyceticus]